MGLRQMQVEHIERTRYLDAVYWTMGCHDREREANEEYLNGRRGSATRAAAGGQTQWTRTSGKSGRCEA